MRIELGSEGQPIPLEALPDTSGQPIPALTLVLAPGDFVPEDYIEQGFTHYQVFCVGAAGGKGGALLGGTGYEGPQNYKGGAGGGGGLHRVSGALEDLPATVPVTVGQVGATGVDNPGQPKWSIISDYGSTSFPSERLAIVDTGARPLVQNGITYINADGSYVSPYTKVDYMGNPIPSDYTAAHNTWEGDGYIPGYSYIVRLNPAWVPSTDGSDGGYSAFGTICKASGGKGGKRAPLFSTGIFVGIRDERGYPFFEEADYLHRAFDGQRHPGGDGGQGGQGNSIIAGGGGQGGSSILKFNLIGTPGAGDYIGADAIPPQDGVWGPESGIGTGGGGGRGGSYVPGPWTPSYGGYYYMGEGVVEPAQSGGQGSFNYGDPSVYGIRQNYGYEFNRQLIPGSGGGAKVNSLLLYGSHAPGYSPNGLVFIKLVKLT